MTYYLIKIVVTAMLVVAITEVAKRSTLAGGILASIPLISVLAMLWLYFETKDLNKVSALATSVFWLVLPSLALFLVLPLLLRSGFGFYPSMGVAIFTTVLCYFALIAILGNFGIRF